GQVAVSGADLEPGATARRGRNLLVVVHLAEQDGAVGEAELEQVLLPEVAPALPADQRQQADDEQQVEGEGTAAQGGHREAEEFAATAARCGGGRNHGRRSSHSCA